MIVFEDGAVEKAAGECAVSVAFNDGFRGCQGLRRRKGVYCMAIGGWIRGWR